MRLRVTFDSIRIIDDLDKVGAGEWEVTGEINQEVLSSFQMKVKTGDNISLGGETWTKEVVIDAQNNEKLTIEIEGFENDPFVDDDIGIIHAVFDQNFSPAWAIGTVKLLSSKHYYELSISVVSLIEDI